MGNGIDSLTVTDIDGNEYSTVKIGNQIWTKEDLRTTRYNDGSAIALVTEDSVWSNLTTPAYCLYKNIQNADTTKKYGALYNWYAVNTNKLAPAGWHVPSIAEWNTLRDFLTANGFNWDGTVTGNKIAKSMAATSDWQTSQFPGAIGDDPGKNNKSNFTALPDGFRFHSGVFGYRSIENHWWSSSEAFSGQAYSIYLMKDTTSAQAHVHYKDEGFSVRLIKN